MVHKLEVPVLWLTLLIPLIACLISAVKAKWGYKSLALLNSLALATPLVVIVVGYVRGLLHEGLMDPVVYAHPSVGSFTLLLDGLNTPIVAGISVVTALVALYSARYMYVRLEEMKAHGEIPPGPGTYYFLYTLFSLAMTGLAYSGNLVLFYVFLELTLIPSFLLIAYYGYGDRKRISLMYFVWTHVGAVLFLFGALLYGFSAGTFDFIDPISGEPLVGAAEKSMPASLAKMAFLMMLLGLFIKMAVFGVHMWLPYAHAEAPTPVSALLSPNLIGLAGYATVRIVYTLFPGCLQAYREYVLAWGFLTILYGGLVALRQTDFKRFLAYSSVSQMGYLVVGIATLTTAGISGAMLHYFSHAIGKAVLFLAAGVFITELHGLRDMTSMGGLARLYPITASASLVGFMHLAGIPPSFGLWSELSIIRGLADSYLSAGQGFILLSLLVILSFTITAAYAFTAMKRVFYGTSERLKHAKPEPRGELVYTLAILAFIGLLLFIYPRPLTAPLSRYVNSLIAAIGGE